MRSVSASHSRSPPLPRTTSTSTSVGAPGAVGVDAVVARLVEPDEARLRVAAVRLAHPRHQLAVERVAREQHHLLHLLEQHHLTERLRKPVVGLMAAEAQDWLDPALHG